MAMQQDQPTAEANGRLWSARATDWAEIQEDQCRAVFVAVFDRVRLRPGLAYFDAGCGAGLAAQIAAERGARVAGVDAAKSLLDIARTRVPNGDFRLADLEALPFGDDTFDLVTGFNSFQYAGSPSGALAEAKRVAKPGSRVVVVTWGNPEGMQAASLLAALKPLLPRTSVPSPGPFALSDEAVLRDFAAAAGLVPGEMFDIESPWVYPDLATALRGLRSAGVAARAIENCNEEAVDSAHAEALIPFRKPDGRYEVAATFRCLVARAIS
jgi:SAM-dependent methyltransferase